MTSSKNSSVYTHVSARVLWNILKEFRCFGSAVRRGGMRMAVRWLIGYDYLWIARWVLSDPEILPCPRCRWDGFHRRRCDFH